MQPIATDEQLKEIVRAKYSEIALQDLATNQSSCCGAGGCSTEVYNIMTDDYTGVQGYTADADLGLGCGLPTQFAKIKTGDVVIPDDILDKYLDMQALADMKSGKVGIYSITVYAEKPGAAKAAACCEPGSGCC